MWDTNWNQRVQKCNYLLSVKTLDEKCGIELGRCIGIATEVKDDIRDGKMYLESQKCSELISNNYFSIKYWILYYLLRDAKGLESTVILF